MLPHEKEKFDQVGCNFGSRYWLPVQWALSIVHTSRREQLIDSDHYCERVCEVFYFMVYIKNCHTVHS